MISTSGLKYYSATEVYESLTHQQVTDLHALIQEEEYAVLSEMEELKDDLDQGIQDFNHYLTLTNETPSILPVGDVYMMAVVVYGWVDGDVGRKMIWRLASLRVFDTQRDMDLHKYKEAVKADMSLPIFN